MELEQLIHKQHGTGTPYTHTTFRVPGFVEARKPDGATFREWIYLDVLTQSDEDPRERAQSLLEYALDEIKNATTAKG